MKNKLVEYENYIHNKSYRKLIGKSYRCSCCDSTSDSSLANLDENYKSYLTFHMEEVSKDILCSDCIESDISMNSFWYDVDNKDLDDSLNPLQIDTEPPTEVFVTNTYDDGLDT